MENVTCRGILIFNSTSIALLLSYSFFLTLMPVNVAVVVALPNRSGAWIGIHGARPGPTVTHRTSTCTRASTCFDICNAQRTGEHWIALAVRLLLALFECLVISFTTHRSRCFIFLPGCFTPPRSPAAHGGFCTRASLHHASAAGEGVQPSRKPTYRQRRQ